MSDGGTVRGKTGVIGSRILILGGTEDGLRLHRKLAAVPGLEPCLSLAGRTASPKDLPEDSRIGGFGGVAGLATFLQDNAIAAMVDATHPFAGQISTHADEAAILTGTPWLKFSRPPWTPQAGDNWIVVDDETAAAGRLSAGGTVFVALGAQKLAPFGHRDDVTMILRVVDAPETPLLPFPHRVICGRGPFSLASELALLTRHDVSLIVARNSGGEGASAKLVAARQLNLPVIMIRRPGVSHQKAVTSVDAAFDWVMGLQV